MADQAGSSEHSALCLRLMQLFPRVTRGMRRWQDRAAPAPVPSPLSPRHVAALEQIRGGPLTVGELASRLDRGEWPEPEKLVIFGHHNDLCYSELPKKCVRG